VIIKEKSEKEVIKIPRILARGCVLYLKKEVPAERRGGGVQEKGNKTSQIGP